MADNNERRFNREKRCVLLNHNRNLIQVKDSWQSRTTVGNRRVLLAVKEYCWHLRTTTEYLSTSWIAKNWFSQAAKYIEKSQKKSESKFSNTSFRMINSGNDSM